MKYNMNEKVKVKLTDFGVEILRQNHDELNRLCGGSLGDFEIFTDNDDYYETQMHNLMYIFGRYLYPTNKKLPFEMSIALKITTDI